MGRRAASCWVLEWPHWKLEFITKGRNVAQRGAEREIMILIESLLRAGTFFMCAISSYSLNDLARSGLIWPTFHRRGNEAQRR